MDDFCAALTADTPPGDDALGYASTRLTSSRAARAVALGRCLGSVMALARGPEEQILSIIDQRLVVAPKRSLSSGAISNVFIAFECSVDSATVDTARRARLQGKTVLAVKPPIKTGRKGVEQILEEGIASPFLSPKDIVRAASENHIAS